MSRRDPPRWIDDATRDGPIRDLLESADGPAARLSAQATAQIRARLRRAQRERAPNRRLAFAVAAATMALAGIAVAARLGEWWHAPSTPSLVAPRKDEPVEPLRVEPPPPAGPAIEVVAPPEVKAPIARSRRRAQPRPIAREDRPAAPARVDPPPPPSPAPAPPIERAAAPLPPALDPGLALRAESAIVAAALKALHQEHDPARALELLDDHRARFPSGELSAEATLARTEALLTLRDPKRALEVLDALEIDAMPRRDELLVLRGELRAHEQRCADAIGDFGRALGARLPREMEERALFGRAVCRTEQGDRTGAREDLTHYLRKYAGGRFAERARAALRSGLAE